MFCPPCGARSEVRETRGPFRDRRCTNAACCLDFTTYENVMTLREHHHQCARTRATQIEAHTGSPAAPAKVGSTSRSGLGAPSDPVQAPSGAQEKQSGLPLAASIEVGSTSCPRFGASSDRGGGARGVQGEQKHKQAGATG
jgi:hypothetical protein